jgi:hypothetical protein
MGIRRLRHHFSLRSKTLAATAGIAMAAAGIVALSPASHADSPGEMKTFDFANSCIDVPDGNFQSGTPLRTWGCNGSEAQWFGAFDRGQQYDRGALRNYRNGLCITATEVKGGAAVIQSDCATAILWDTTPFVDGGNLWEGARLQVRGTDLCMDRPGGTLGTPLQLYTCNHIQAAQMWFVSSFGVRMYEDSIRHQPQGPFVPFGGSEPGSYGPATTR